MTDDDVYAESAPGIRNAHSLLASVLGDGVNQPDGEDPRDPNTVQAMPIVLNMPKSSPPRRRELLEAAALASALVCLDPRAGSDGPWKESLSRWYGARIRKIARRARTSGQWSKVQSIPGVTVTIGESSARAFLPGPVRDVDPRIGKLQISGTDLPREDDEQTERIGGSDPLRPTIALNEDLEMSVGKAAAQVGHAAMLWAAHAPFPIVKRWLHEPRFTIVEVSSSELEAAARRYGVGHYVEVVDAGFTEVAPGSKTAVAFDPDVPTS
ncbi:aminoacyl-tRNA hydrolase [Corynebacterium sp.]|uniref:aminoacyl-tRNA hydrolase n=1 Tax=Corynebacterium sp. TaxID=1720 RepID=UPI0026DCA388|nr:aminoacyl-tRNA hydrolase [Corynebacterium sp.]MDO4915116.1 aminoacyl-tRNA hydrolase [Corynebacterium sp.]